MMRRREALTLLAGVLLPASLATTVLAKPGKGNGNGNGHGGGNGGGGDNTGGSGGDTGGHGGGPKPKSVVLNGVVKAVASTGFTLHVNGHGPGGSDVTVTVSTDTQFVKGMAPVDPATMAVGALVQVRGTLDASTQTLTATQVKLKKPGKDNGGGDDSGGDHGGVEVEGTVASVNTTGFVLHPAAVAGVQPPDVSVAVTGTTTFTRPDGSTGSMADVTVGAAVKARGSVDPASMTLVATSVTVKTVP